MRTDLPELEVYYLATGTFIIVREIFQIFVKNEDIGLHRSNGEFICHETTGDQRVRFEHGRANLVIPPNIYFDIIATFEIVGRHSRLILQFADESLSFLRIFWIQVFQIDSSDVRAE